MKKYIILFALTVFLSPLQAQNSFADMLKGKSGNLEYLTDIVKKGVCSELFVARQQYVLKQGTNAYGKNGKTYYGESFSLGIKIAGGSILQRTVVFPWAEDDAYKQVNSRGNYEPVPYKGYRKNINDSVFVATNFEIGTQYLTPLMADSSLYFHADAYNDFGLYVDESAGDKDGFMIWAYAIPSAQDSMMSVKLRTSSERIFASSDSSSLSMSPADRESVIGGLYIVPKYERAGRIQLLLVGVATKGNGGMWRLNLLTKEKRISSTNIEKKEEDVDEELKSLTPIKQQKQRI